jgi:hypothetical protein
MAQSRWNKKCERKKRLDWIWLYHIIELSLAYGSFCGRRHFAMLASGGRYIRGAWQCIDDCKLDD